MRVGRKIINVIVYGYGKYYFKTTFWARKYVVGYDAVCALCESGNSCPSAIFSNASWNYTQYQVESFVDTSRCRVVRFDITVSGYADAQAQRDRSTNIGRLEIEDVKWSGLIPFHTDLLGKPGVFNNNAASRKGNPKGELMGLRN